MTGLQHFFLSAGALFGLLGVGAGAFGAHILKTKLSETSFDVFEIAVRYQMYHALALIALAALNHLFPSIWFSIAGWLFIFGISVFSGTLYAYIFSGLHAWGAVTPIGGVLLLLGWLSLLLGALLT